jgi:hypothetical protein
MWFKEKRNMSKGTAATLLILMVLVIAVVSPLLAIWSINTLFGTTIAYGIGEWFAALVLIGIVQGNRNWRHSPT